MDVFANAGPIVGRQAELGALEAALSGLGEGHAGFLSFEGEPGIGKTRLLRELRERAAREGHLVLAGAGAEFERDLPYGVWVDAMDAYVASQDLAFADEVTHELGRVLPSLDAGDGDGAMVADERYRVHRAMRSLLAALSDNQALLLVLDDLQWADDASLELLGALLGRDLGASVLLAIGFRSGQAPEPLSAALAARSDARHVLAPLDEAQAAELLSGVERDAASAIISRGGGVPFYLEQLARAGSTTAAPAGGSNGLALGGVPDAVVATLAQELNALSPAARGLLDAAAVTGEPFELDLAAAVAGAGAGDALDALDELLAADLVRATAVPRRFAFRHPIVRQAVYESLRAGRRLAAHARAAEELAARGASASERAAHVEFAAAQGDEAAIAVLLEAGDETLGRAPTSSARWYDAALRLLPGGDREQQVKVLMLLASALRASGDLERCRTTLLDALARLPPQADARRVELTAMCAAVEHWQGRHGEAHRRLAGAYEDLTDHDTPQAAVLQIELAVDSLYELDHPHAVAMAQEALATAQRLEDRGLVLAAAAALALAAAGAHCTGPGASRVAVAELERLPEPELARRLDALYHLGWAENYLERYDDAVAHADRGLELARATGQGRLLVPLLLVKGYPFEMQGRLAEAHEAAQTAIEIARLSANPHYLFWAWFEVAWAHYYAGDLTAAIEACEESQRVGDGKLTLGTMPSAGGGPGWAKAAAQLETGDAPGALAMVEQLGDDDLHWAIPVERCFNWESIALAEIAVGKLDEAERHAAKAEETAAALGLHIPTAAAARTRSAVALAAGDTGAARAAGELAVESADAVGATLQAAFARLALGRALVAADERKAAIATLREAEQDFGRCGSHRARDEARRELRKLGARAEPRGPAAAESSGVGALTKREREIAGLVTDRMTNREIAAELFLSDKTVESHIRNIFIKLGVSSRVEVARAVERDGAVVSTDAALLNELGYEQELERSLPISSNVALGFAGISPVVGLYAVVFVGTVVAGPAWVWVLPIALAGQCLLLTVYSELASQWPLTGGAYQWTRRLMGEGYGWMTGWVAIWAYLVANTTVAYLGAPWALAVFGIEPTANRIVVTGMVLVVVCAIAGALGVQVLARAVKAGIAAEVVASVGIGLALLLVFRENGPSLLTHTLGAEALSGGSTGAALLAALAVGGWVFIGFDCCVAASEETQDAARHVPRAIWIALLSVAALVMLNAVAATLAHPDPASVVAGEDPDPVATAVASGFGSWSEKPFAAIVLVAFLACGMAAQALTARTVFSLSRDGALPASRSLRIVDRRHVPIGAVVLTTVVACLGLLLGLNSAAVGSLITFGTAAIYLTFFLIALAALIARVSGRWVGRRAATLNALAVAWLAFETVNIAWPRRSLAPPDAPDYQVWAAPLFIGAVCVFGLIYLVVAQPHRRAALGDADPANLGGAGAAGHEVGEQAQR